MLTVGYQHFLIDFGDLEDAQYLPVGGAARLKLFGFLDAGADAGYAIGITDYLDGGFYIRPVAGLDIADTIELFVSYLSVFDEATWGNLNAGILIEI